MKRNTFETLNKLFLQIYQLMILHFLWLIGVGIGLGILGFGPATAALFATIRQLLKEPSDFSLFKAFFGYYFKDFWKANGLFYLEAIFGSILFLNINFMLQTESIWQFPLLVLLFSIAVVYVIYCTLSFPAFVHYDLKLSALLQQIFWVAISRSVYIIIIFAVVLGLYLLILTRLFPLLFFFGVSPAAMIIMLLCYHLILKKLDVAAEE